MTTILRARVAHTPRDPFEGWKSGRTERKHALKPLFLLINVFMLGWLAWALSPGYRRRLAANASLAALSPGETVLIHNAGGGVGIAATQLARLRRAVTCGGAPLKLTPRDLTKYLQERATRQFVYIERGMPPDDARRVVAPRGDGVVHIGAELFLGDVGTRHFTTLSGAPPSDSSMIRRRSRARARGDITVP